MKKLFLFICLTPLLFSASFVMTPKIESNPTCTGQITSVSVSGGCVSGGQNTEICITWTGTIPALGLTNINGFTVTSSNPEDVCCGFHCFDITVGSGRTDVIYFNIEGAGGSCYQVNFGSYCIDNCSGLSCS